MTRSVNGDDFDVFGTFVIRAFQKGILLPLTDLYFLTYGAFFCIVS